MFEWKMLNTCKILLIINIIVHFNYKDTVCDVTEEN